MAGASVAAMPWTRAASGGVLLAQPPRARRAMTRKMAFMLLHPSRRERFCRRHERHEGQFSPAARCAEACAGHPGMLQDVRHPAYSECGCATSATRSIEGGQRASRSSRQRHRQFPAGERVRALQDTTSLRTMASSKCSTLSLRRNFSNASRRDSSGSFACSDARRCGSIVETCLRSRIGRFQVLSQDVHL